MKALGGVVAVAGLVGFVVLLLADSLRDAQTLVCSVPVGIALLAFGALSWVRSERKRVGGQGIILGLLFLLPVAIGGYMLLTWAGAPKDASPFMVIVGMGISLAISLFYFSQALEAQVRGE